MLNALKRLSLGLLLIVLASAILLVADLGRRTGVRPNVPRIAIVQQANTPPLDDGIGGLLDGLAALGFHDGTTISIQRFNAQGDMATAVAIARQVTAGDFDLVVTSSTPSLQAVANSNRDGKVRHVFFLVADPFVAGVGLDRANPLKHPAHMVGQGVFPPVDRAFWAARQALPSLARVGVAWNPSEANSAAFVAKARLVAKDLGLELLEANVDSSSAVGEAVSSLIARGAQAIWMGGDTSVNAAVDTLIATSRRAGVPVFTSLPGRPDRGTLVDIGPDFHEAGMRAADLVRDVLQGADIATIPVRDVIDLVPPFLSVNMTALKGLREPWRIPDDVLREANVLVDLGGIHRKAAPRPAAPAASGQPLARKWRVSFIELNSVVDVEEAEQGVLEGLREAGLVRGRDYEVTILNAQGDMATVSSMVDAAMSAGSDMLITFSTPTLQAALQKAKSVPVVFTYVSDAVAAGAGRSDTDHAPNVTGVYMLGAFDQMLAIVRRVLPKSRVLGTVYVPAEVNMVVNRDALVKAAAKAGFEIRAVAANSPNEVAEAALALTAGGVDAVCQIPGNLTAAAFPSIAQVTRQARLPVFAFQTSQVRGGAVLAVARDYHDSGREAARLAARIMRGENPAAIPFVHFAKTRLVVNAGAAAQLGLAIPDDIVARADERIGAATTSAGTGGGARK